MEVCYRYDGTFDGFLTCVFEIYTTSRLWTSAFPLTTLPFLRNGRS